MTKKKRRRNNITAYRKAEPVDSSKFAGIIVYIRQKVLFWSIHPEKIIGYILRLLMAAAWSR